jgi:hypothetical protein
MMASASKRIRAELAFGVVHPVTGLCQVLLAAVFVTQRMQGCSNGDGQGCGEGWQGVLKNAARGCVFTHAGVLCFC